MDTPVEQREVEDGGGWWGSLGDMASAAAQALKEDFGEFGTVVATDTSAAAEVVVETTAAKVSEVTEVATQYMDTIDTLSKDNQTAEGTQERVRSTWLSQQEAHLGRDEKTFTTDPAASPDAMMYVEWLETFRLADRAPETASLLREHPHMLKYHIKMVPDLVTNEVFWTRYFWQCKKIELDADRRAALVQRAAQDAEDDEEEGWGEWDEEATPVKDAKEVESKEPIGDESETSATREDPLETETPGADDGIPVSDDWGYSSPVSAGRTQATGSSGIKMPPATEPVKSTEVAPAPSRAFSMPPPFVPVALAPVSNLSTKENVSKSSTDECVVSPPTNNSQQETKKGFHSSNSSLSSGLGSWDDVCKEEVPVIEPVIEPVNAEPVTVVPEDGDDWGDWE